MDAKLFPYDYQINLVLGGVGFIAHPAQKAGLRLNYGSFSFVFASLLMVSGILLWNTLK